MLCPGPTRPFSIMCASSRDTIPVSEPTTSNPSSVREYRSGLRPLRSMPATTQSPSAAQIAAGPSHDSMTQLQKLKKAACSGGILGFFDHASGIIRDFTIGAVRPARTRSSNTASSAAESELPDWITGLISSIWLSSNSDTNRVSWLRIQFTLPDKVFISPL